MENGPSKHPSKEIRTLHTVLFWNGPSIKDRRATDLEKDLRGWRHKCFERNMRIAIENGEPLVHPPQIKLANELFRTFLTTQALLITICAPMQWGKTGIIVYLAYRALAAKDEPAKVQKLVVITGMSDKDWTRQTKKRFECLGTDSGVSVFHRGALRKQTDMFAKLENALVVIDECHYGNGKKQSLDDFLKSACLLNHDQLVHRNVRFVQVSATPDSSLVVPQGWTEKNLHRTMVADWRIESYISPKDMLDKKRVLGTRDLTRIDNVRDAVVQFAGRKGIIFVRTPNKKIKAKSVLKNFETVKAELDKDKDSASFDILKHDSSVGKHDREKNTALLLKYLTEGPGQLVVVFIRKFFQAAKTFKCHDHIISLYEPPATNNSTAAVVQSWVGRMCGHHRNRSALIYANVGSVKQYIDLMESDFDLRRVENYKTTTIVKHRGSILVKRQPYVASLGTGEGKARKESDTTHEPKLVPEPNSMTKIRNEYKHICDFLRKNSMKGKWCAVAGDIRRYVYHKRDETEKNVSHGSKSQLSILDERKWRNAQTVDANTPGLLVKRRDRNLYVRLNDHTSTNAT